MNLREVRNGEWIAGAAGAALIAALFLPWYGADGTSATINAWQSFSVLDVILLVCGVFGVLLLLAEIQQRTSAVPLAIGGLGTWLGLIATALVLFRGLAFPPGEGTTREWGVYVALVASATLFAGFWRSIGDERIRLRDGRWSRPSGGVVADEVELKSIGTPVSGGSARGHDLPAPYARRRRRRRGGARAALRHVGDLVRDQGRRRRARRAEPDLDLRRPVRRDRPRRRRRRQAHRRGRRAERLAGRRAGRPRDPVRPARRGRHGDRRGLAARRQRALRGPVDPERRDDVGGSRGDAAGRLPHRPETGGGRRRGGKIGAPLGLVCVGVLALGARAAWRGETAAARADEAAAVPEREPVLVGAGDAPPEPLWDHDTDETWAIGWDHDTDETEAVTRDTVPPEEARGSKRRRGRRR